MRRLNGVRLAQRIPAPEQASSTIPKEDDHFIGYEGDSFDRSKDANKPEVRHIGSP